MEENNVLDKGTVDRPGEKPAAITDRIEAESMDELIRLFGVFDENLRIIEEETGVRMATESDCVRVSGNEDSVKLAKTVTDKLLTMLRRGEAIDRSRIATLLTLRKRGTPTLSKNLWTT